MTNYFAENKPSEDFAGRSLRGGVVSIGARVINALVQVGSVVFLARLLSPEDYGLVAMASAIVGIVPLLLDLGTRDAVVQQPHITPGEISALFWIIIGVGCGSAALVATSGPLIARFYGEPRLTAVVLVSSLSLVVLPLSYQHQALLRRAMMYRECAMIDIGANVVSTALAVGMAFRGCGYWALVLRPVATNIVTAVGAWWTCSWRPRRPTFTVGVKEMLKFGTRWAAFSGTDFAGKYSDRIAIGYAYGAIGLGYYQKACLIYDNCLELVTTAIYPVAAVGFSKLRNNLDELRSSWAKAISTLAFFAMPALGILAVTSQDVVVFALGQKWVNAGVLLSILALRGIPHVVERTVAWLHIAAGRADRLMRWGIIATVSQLVVLFAGLPFGTVGIAWAYVLCMYIIFLPAIAYGGRPVGIGPGKIVRAVGPQMVGALAGVLLGFVLRVTVFADTPIPVRTLLLAILFSGAYILIVVGLFKVRTPLEVGRAIVRAVGYVTSSSKSRGVNSSF
jgi:polysaccharide transporter, PST family